MTIERMVVENAFEDSAWPLFNKKRGKAILGHIPAISVISYIDTDANSLSSPQSHVEQCAETVERDFFFASAASNKSMYLFIADAEWKPSTKVNAYKGLWKALPHAMMKDFLLGDEVMFTSDKGMRNAGVAQVPDEHFLAAVGLLGPSRALILSDRNLKSTTEVEAIFRAAFPIKSGVEQLDIDWMLLAAQLCPLGDIVLRSGVEHNARTVFIDLFLATILKPCDI